MRVPFLDLHPQYAAVRDEALAAITRVCDSLQFIHGPDCEAFEAEAVEAVGTRHAFAFVASAVAEHGG